MLEAVQQFITNLGLAQAILYILAAVIFIMGTYSVFFTKEETNPYFDVHAHISYAENSIKNKAIGVENHETDGLASVHKKISRPTESFIKKIYKKKNHSAISVLISQRRPHSHGWES